MSLSGLGSLAGDARRSRPALAFELASEELVKSALDELCARYPIIRECVESGGPEAMRVVAELRDNLSQVPQLER